MSHYMNVTSTNFYDIPKFNFLLEQYGYYKIILPELERADIYFNHTTDELIVIKKNEVVPENCKFLKNKVIITDEYNELAERKQKIYNFVSDEYYNLQKTVFENNIVKELEITDKNVIGNLFNVAYNNAYDKGHSSGHDEVTCLQTETNNCIAYIKALNVKET